MILMDQPWFWPTCVSAVVVAILGFIAWYTQIRIQRELDWKDKLLPRYQEVSSHIQKLERSLSQIQDWHLVEPQVNNLRNCKIQNDLYLDDRTNKAVNGLIIEIEMQYTKESTLQTSMPINLLINENVNNKMTTANDAILIATGRKKGILTYPKDQLESGRHELSLQIPILTILSLLLFYVFLSRLPDASTWDIWFFAGLSILVLLFSVFLCVVVYLPVRFNFVAKFISVTKTSVWKTAYIECLILNYSCILVLLLASIATKEASKQIDICWFYIFYIVGLAILLAVAAFPFTNWPKKNKLPQIK